ncbi:Phosphopantetheine attachment site, partial [Actinopolyspora mzabensis]
ASCGRVVWVFPGQGGQFPGMCRSLLGDEVFRAALVECDGALRPYTGFSVVELLEADEESQREQLERVTVVQPVLFAVGVALSRVWGCWGVSPDAVVGHSQGEVAAAVAAGVLSVAEGARVVGVRSRLVAGLAGDGGMGSVALPVAQVRRRLAEWGGALSVAVVNTAESTVVAGDRQELEEFLAVLEGEGVSCRRIKVDYASHSPQVDPVLGEIRSELADLAPTTGDVPVVSTVRGARVDGSELDGDYWADNLRQPVRLDLALEDLAPGEDTVFLELGAHPLLVGPLGGAGHVAVGSLHRDEDGASRLRQAAAELFAHGIPIDWDTVYAGTNTQTVDLPTYAFQHQHYWLDVTPSAPNGASNGTGVVEEPLWEAVRAHEVDTVADMLEIPEQRHEDLAALLPHLARWRTRRAAGAELANWLYEEQWISVPSHGDVIRPSGTWLLLSEQPGAQRAESIAAAVEAAGAEVLRLELADDPDEAATRLASAAADTPLSGVLLVAGAESDAPSEPSLESDPQLTSRLTRWVVRLRSIVRTLREVSGDAPLWLLTTGAVGTASETPEGELHDPSRSALWGLGRVVGLEHPDLLGGLVDLPAGPLDRSTTDALITAITADDAEDQLALRPDRDGSAQRLVRRVVRARPEVEVADSGFALAGTVLVTGGTGGLGARTARWLAECAREQLHLVLTSRSGAAAPGAAALREELESLGARVTLASCDVAERTELERLLSGLDEPVRAVFHAAGATEPRPLASHDAVYVERELSAKVAGAANLHALLDPEPLEAFVLYGSLAGFWGSGEQGAYAAANAFLDGLTRRRRARGVPATIVHWGSWGEGGMVSAETDAQLRRRGIPPMAPEVAIRGLELALRDGRPALAVADVEWSSFTASYAAGRPRPLLHGVDEARRALEGETHQDEDHDRAATRLGERLRAVPVDKREETVLEAVRAEIAAVFGMSEAAAVPSDRPLRDSGLDSMMAVQMRNRLAVLCGTKLPPSLLFDYPTPEDLAAYLTHLLRDEVDDLTGLESVLERLEHLPDETLRQPRFSRRIAALTRRLESHETTAEPRSDSEIRTSVADVSDDDLLTFIDQEIEDL